MKRALLILNLTFCAYFAFSQIPNNSFEDWTPINNYEKPDDWVTNQDTFFSRITRDTVSVSGNYSLKMYSQAPSAWQNCNSIIETTIDPTGTNNQSLYFFVKCLPDTTYNPLNRVYLELEGRTFQFGNYSFFSWEQEDPIVSFTEVEIPLPQTNNPISIKISGSSYNGPTDGCHFQSTIWLDDFSVRPRNTINTNAFENNRVIISPNPSNGMLHVLQDIFEYEEYELFDILGRTIQTGTISNHQILVQEKGTFILKLKSSFVENRFFVQKIVVL